LPLHPQNRRRLPNGIQSTLTIQINIFIDGKFHGEYPGADEIKPFIAYIKKKVLDYQKTMKKVVEIGEGYSEERKDGDPQDSNAGKSASGFNPLYLIIVVVVGLVAFMAYRTFSKSQYAKVARADK
jgi:hypothetical protein